MTGVASGDGSSAAARLLERERRIAAIESGHGLLLESCAPGECLACLHGPLLTNPVRVGLVIVPQEGHSLCRAARASALPVRAIIVTPHMTDAERRDLGIALQNHTIQLVFVTPERLGQPRFVQFIRGLSLAYVAVASCQLLTQESGPYEACWALRGLFPGVPVLAMADGALGENERHLLQDALAFPPALRERAAPSPVMEFAAPDEPAVLALPVAREAPPTPIIAAPPRNNVIPEQYQSAFVRFEQDLSVSEAAVALGRDEAWVWQALTAFIRHTGRTHPFPWVSKPAYMSVSMAAGQAETTNPRLIASVMGGAVDECEILVVLAALDNRNGKG